MAIIENRIRKSSDLIQLIKTGVTFLKNFLIVWLVAISLYFWFASPKKLSAISLEFTGDILSKGAIIYESIFSSIKKMSQKWLYFENLTQKNIELKLEIAELKYLQKDLELIKAENIALKKLLLVTNEEHEYITAKLLNVSLNPFGHTAIINAGLKQGISTDQIVLNSDGLIGKIVETSNNYSKAMLITDVNSRVPITILPSQNNGILAGDGHISRILYLPNNHLMQKGEQVVTSGSGNVYPSGITVGTISKIIGDEAFVNPIVDLSTTKFVKILLFYKDK